MKKLKLKLDGIKEMLTKEQMKKISGGYDNGTCSAPSFCDSTPNYVCPDPGCNCDMIDFGNEGVSWLCG